MKEFYTIRQMLSRLAEKTPEAVAVQASDRKSLTYRSLFLHVEKVVKCLNGAGISWNDRVAIVLPNGPEMATAFLSVSAGATSAPLNPSYRQRSLNFIYLILMQKPY